MKVILFRHGPAGKRDAKRWPDDAQRPLTERGSLRTRLAAEGLARIEPDLDRILSSPLLRATQTASVLSEAYANGVKVEETESLAPSHSMRPLLARLVELRDAEVVALVGHEPELGKLAGALTGAPGPLPLKKAGACAIRLDGGPKPGAGRLEWFLPPRVLRRHVRRPRKSRV
jgi:phosphohistidine phosphatase